MNPFDEVETRTMGIATVDEFVRWLEDRQRDASVTLRLPLSSQQAAHERGKESAYARTLAHLRAITRRGR